MSRWRRLRVIVRFRTPKRGLPRFLTGSFAVHGMVLAAIVIVPATHHKVMPIDDAMVVALSGPIAAAPAPQSSAAVAPSTKPAATPPPAPAPKEAHTVHEVPVPKPKDKTPKPKPQPSKEPESAAPPHAPKGATGPTGPTGPANGAGAVTATLGTGDSSLNWYGAAVKAALESAWVKPFLEDAAGTASVVVGFDIARDGTTRNFRIIQSSGIPTLDRSAERAVLEASPLPAIPPTFSGDSIPVTMRFDLSPEAR